MLYHHHLHIISFFGLHVFEIVFKKFVCLTLVIALTDHCVNSYLLIYIFFLFYVPLSIITVVLINLLPFSPSFNLPLSGSYILRSFGTFHPQQCFFHSNLHPHLYVLASFLPPLLFTLSYLLYTWHHSQAIEYEVKRAEHREVERNEKNDAYDAEILAAKKTHGEGIDRCGRMICILLYCTVLSFELASVSYCSVKCRPSFV